VWRGTLQRGVAWTLDIPDGLALGMAILLPFFLLGGMGAGDVKMLGAAGAIAGGWALLNIFVYFGVLGGMVGLAAAIAYSRFGAVLRNTIQQHAVGRAAGSRQRNSIAAPPLPYGAVIARVLVVPLDWIKNNMTRDRVDDVRHWWLFAALISWFVYHQAPSFDAM